MLDGSRAELFSAGLVVRPRVFHRSADAQAEENVVALEDDSPGAHHTPTRVRYCSTDHGLKGVLQLHQARPC